MISKHPMGRVLHAALPYLWLVAIVVAPAAWGFIPPLNGIVGEMVDLRSNNPVEMVWKHRVTTAAGVTEVDESLFCDRGNLSIQWRFGGQTVAGQLTPKGYAIAGSQRVLPVHSMIFTKAMCAITAEDVREALLQERFIRREQLVQFKPTYQPTGDPNTWDTKSNYVLHDDIYLKRLRSGISIAVVGTDSEAGRRALYFDRPSANVARIEWRNGNDVFAWNFEKFAATEGRGLFPRKASFEAVGAERINSDLAFTRSFSEKTVAAHRAERQRVATVAPTDEQLAVLSTLLGYR